MSTLSEITSRNSKYATETTYSGEPLIDHGDWTSGGHVVATTKMSLGGVEDGPGSWSNKVKSQVGDLTPSQEEKLNQTMSDFFNSQVKSRLQAHEDFATGKIHDVEDDGRGNLSVSTETPSYLLGDDPTFGELQDKENAAFENFQFPEYSDPEVKSFVDSYAQSLKTGNNENFLRNYAQDPVNVSIGEIEDTTNSGPISLHINGVDQKIYSENGTVEVSSTVDMGDSDQIVKDLLDGSGYDQVTRDTSPEWNQAFNNIIGEYSAIQRQENTYPPSDRRSISTVVNESSSDNGHLVYDVSSQADKDSGKSLRDLQNNSRWSSRGLKTERSISGIGMEHNKDYIKSFAEQEARKAMG